MMRKITFRGLRAHPVRFIATMLAVIFGTAFLSGALVLKESVATTFEGNTTAALRGVDAAVAPDTEAAEENFIVAPGVPADALDKVRAAPGVRAAAGTLEGPLGLLGADGKLVKPRGTGILRIDDAALSPYSLDNGAWPEQSGEIAIDRITMQERGLAVGSAIDVSTTSGRHAAKIVGTVSYLTLGRDTDNPNVIVHGSDAFAWLGSGAAEYNHILVAKTEGTSVPDLVSATKTAVGPGAIVMSGDEFRTDQAGAAAGIANVLGTGLTVFAYVALFICLFIIYNTFTTVVAQRTRELALLRAIGASGKQVRRAVLLEALAVGIIASGLGLLFGILLALLLAKAAPGLVSAGGGTDVNLAVSPGTVIQVMIAGLIVTLLSAVIPAFRSSRVKPLEAMRTSDVDRSGSSKFRAVVGIALTVIGIVSLALAPILKTAWFLLPGPPALFLGLLFAGPVLASRFARIAGVPLGSKRSITSRIATDNLRRNPRRAATTANALVIGVFLVVFVTAAGGAMRDFLVDIVSSFSGADLNVSSENGDAIPPGIGEEIARVPGVAESVAIYGNFGRANLKGDTTAGDMGGGAVFPPAAADLSRAAAALGLEHKGGKQLNEIGSGQAAVADFSSFAGGGGGGNQPGIPKLGDIMTITTGAGATRDFEIVSLVSFSISIPPMLISPEDALALDPAAPVVQYSIKTVPGEAPAVKDKLDAITNDYTNVIVYEGSFITGFLTTFFNGLIAAVNALLGAAVVVAIFGIVNTLILAITERTREIGLLRAVGMSRTQLRTTITIESVLVSLLGTLLGVVSGLYVAWCLAAAVLESGNTGFSWPVVQLVLITVAGVIVGVLASIIPAYRAGRLDILDSIHAE